MIPVTKPYFPPIEKYQKYLSDIYQRQWLTNSGPLHQELTQRLEDYLGVQNLLLVSNGTLALQVAFKALGLQADGKVLTTPFTFAATPGALAWEGLKPVFSDICPKSFNLAAGTLPENGNFSAILGVHVFGNPCETQAIQAYADARQAKVIYDAAHAFGVTQKGKSVLCAGDASTLSFHATKLFHTVEGGAIVFRQREDFERAKQMINFGLDSHGIPQTIGINAKLSEVHAAMGLAVLDDIQRITERRLAIVNQYKLNLQGCVGFQHWQEGASINGAYMPVVLESEADINRCVKNLQEEQVYPRRYFYPSLNKAPAFYQQSDCSNSESLANRILCLPLYTDLSTQEVDRICHILKSGLSS
ncbi:DegT/DnrJ/EryC1/StrS family aminotransferase [Bowmanella denitrificans]|uniref:DegT/DnrJ/EryC1/StrS family aminotransferase n=1 Tax=Bowmanella denitrificans TaxID=366582 RepID=A0ABN0X2Q8_9ALTE